MITHQKEDVATTISDMKDDRTFMILASEMADGIHNPIRSIVDNWTIPVSSPEKPMIPLSIGMMILIVIMTGVYEGEW